MTERRALLAALALALALALAGCGGGEEPPVAAPPVPPPPQVLEARQALFGGDAARAVEILEPFVASEPDVPEAWSLLGSARRSLGDADGALAALERAAGFADTRPRALYGIAAIHAQAGRIDEAFAALDEARATGRIDLTRAASDPAMAALRDDPRYADLLPPRDALDAPFVEGVRVIHEWRGESPGDAFGWIARDVGDVDGDGVHDAVVSANGHDANAGRVYLYSGASGELLWTRDGEPGARLGTGLEAAGDVNGDGVPDVIAGAPNGGYALVLSGSDGATLHDIRGDAAAAFGQAACGAGDVDGDGRADVIVGAPGHDASGEDAGRAIVVSGRDGSILRELFGPAAGARFGSAVAGAGRGPENVLVIGAPAGGPDGRAFVYLGGAPDPSHVLRPGSTAGSFGGMFVSVVGDVDADGRPDVYVSDWGDTALGPQTGRVYVVSAVDGETILERGGEQPGEGFGTSPAVAGDLDGDGHDDLTVGAWQHASGAPGGGRVTVLSGADGSVLRTITSRAMGDTLGFDAVGLGDVDGDGRDDLLLTAAWSAVNGPRSGRAFVIAGE